MESKSRRRWLMPASIRGRILLFFAAIIMVLAVMAGSAVWITHQYRETAEQEQAHATISSLLNTVAREGAAGAVYLQFYLATGDDAFLEQSQASLAASSSSLLQTAQQMRASGRTEDAAQIEAIIVESSGVAEVWGQAMALAASGDIAGASELLAVSQTTVQNMAARLEAIVEEEQAEIDALSSDAATVTRTATYVTVVLGALSVIGAAAAFWVLARSILRPLGELQTSARSLAAGELTARAPVHGPAELAALGGAFNQMTDALLDASRRRELEEERERAYAALRESEDKWRSLIQNAQDVITVIGPDAMIEYESPSVERIMGYPPEEMIGERALDYIHPDDRESVSVALAETIRTQRPARVEFRFRHKDGSWRHMESVGMLIQGAKGTRVIANSRDVSERRAAEEQVRFQADLLAAVADAVIATDLNGIVLYWNEAAERLYGWQSEEVLGQPLDGILPSANENYGPREAIARVATGESFIVEFATRTKAGDWVPVEVSLSPLRDAAGRIVGAIGDSHDISERKAAEDTIRHMAYHDALTGLPNRLLLKDRFAMALAHAKRSGALLGVISLDLDRFKNINDSLGHSSGDELLMQASRRLVACVREEDTVARLGGDEFMVLLTGLQSEDEGFEAAARIVDEFRAPFKIKNNGDLYHTTPSVGIAFCDDECDL
jgi:diguanylate cyclase (GGDEF)-like protein/PAS domain S-box-containing protein